MFPETFTLDVMAPFTTANLWTLYLYGALFFAGVGWALVHASYHFLDVRMAAYHTSVHSWALLAGVLVGVAWPYFLYQMISGGVEAKRNRKAASK